MNTRPVTKSRTNQTQQGLNFQNPKKVLDFLLSSLASLVGFSFLGGEYGN
jgi:hypothetical protein